MTPVGERWQALVRARQAQEALEDGALLKAAAVVEGHNLNPLVPPMQPPSVAPVPPALNIEERMLLGEEEDDDDDQEVDKNEGS